MRRNRSAPLSLGVLVALIAIASWWLLSQSASDAPDPDAPRSVASADAREVFTPFGGGEAPDTAPTAVEGDVTATRLVAPDMSPTIAGTVRFTTGEPAGMGLHVVAWTPGDTPTAAALSDGSWPLSALTDDAGRFAISGLTSGASYVVCAAGRGLHNWPAWPTAKTPAGTLDLSLEVARIYGVRILVRDEHGDPPITNPSLGGRGPNSSQPKGSLQLLAPSSPLIGFTGLRDDDLTRRERDAIVLLALGGAQPPEPIDVGGQVAGYEAYHMQLPLGFVGNGLPTSVIRLHRLTEGFARLKVQCFGTGPEIAPPPTTQGRGRVWVEMKPKDEDGKFIGFSLVLGAVPWHGTSFDRIPVGRYAVRLWAEHRFLSVPSEDKPMRDFDVLPGDNLLAFDVGELGALELGLQRPDGLPWQHALNLELFSDALGTALHETDHFDGPPYILEGLPPGRYRVQVTYPFAAQVEGDDDGYVTLDGASLQHVTARSVEATAAR